MSCPIKVTKLKCIDGKFVKRAKDKVKTGKAKNKKGILFNLEEKILKEDKQKLKDKQNFKKFLK